MSFGTFSKSSGTSQSVSIPQPPHVNQTLRVIIASLTGSYNTEVSGVGAVGLNAQAHLNIKEVKIDKFVQQSPNKVEGNHYKLQTVAKMFEN